MIVKEDGTKVGYNSDYRAAMDSLEAAYGGPLEGGVSPLMNKQVVILGAGGVARPIGFGMVRRGAVVTLCNRNEEKATKLAEELTCRTANWSMRASMLPDILINCTPVGMHPNVDDTAMPPAGFRPGMVVMDTVYHPENTMLLKLARERECKTVSGVDMFVRQAAIQSNLYTGQEPPVDLMREVVARKLGPIRS
jgi:3-dehydroquinate dehydratase/shikimate dehydrogenase